MINNNSNDKESIKNNGSIKFCAKVLCNLMVGDNISSKMYRVKEIKTNGLHFTY